MSDGSDPGPLVRATRRQRLSASASILQGHSPPLRQETPLYGIRGLRHPAMGLRAVRQLGPVRHALEQRAVCGTLEIHAPFSDHGKEKP